ncbi:MAG: siderophore biosynthesis protein [Cyanobacteria bacterium J06558_2]
MSATPGSSNLGRRSSTIDNNLNQFLPGSIKQIQESSAAELTLDTTLPSPHKIWQGFHWSFFINIQGLIICLRRFEKEVRSHNFSEAEVELKTATELMLASSASMILAGSFSKQEYDTQVRETMMPPYVKSDNFSGLMSWEHSALIQVWMRLSPIFADLPNVLKPAHQNFINAYRELANAHRAVCEKFVGAHSGSLRCKANTALNTLDKFNSHRQSLIDPSSKKSCPFHNHG